MKKIIVSFLLSCLFICQNSLAQNSSCSDPDPFCVTTTVQTFNINSTGVDASSTNPGNDYGCLDTSPSPSWFYIKIQNGGDLSMHMTGYDASQSRVDVDFILYGPFSNLAEAKGQCGSYGVSSMNIIDCSYSADSDEDIDISSAASGQVYILLVTGYDPRSFSYTVQKTGGTATTDCSNINTGNCGETNYDIGGAFGDYFNGMNATTVFCPAQAGGTVTLNFTSFVTETCCDKLYIYNGSSASATLLGIYQGTNSPGSITSTIEGGGCITIRFSTDNSVVASGYAYTVVCNAPPNCVTTIPTSASASANSFCAGTAGNITLSATGGEGAKLMWYKTSCGSGTAIGMGSPLQIAIPTTSTSYFARWESVCGASACVEVPITIIPLPSPAIIGDLTVCRDSVLRLSTANTGNDFLWNYITPGSGVIAEGQGTNTITLNVGNFGGTLTLAETNSSNCRKTISVPISIISPVTPLAMAGDDKAICLTAIQLSANNSVGAWTVKSGAGNFSPSASEYNATVSGLSVGLNEFVWTSAGRCGLFARDAVAIFLRDFALDVNASCSSDTVCIGSPKNLIVKVNGNGSGKYSYSWTSSDYSYRLTLDVPEAIVTPIGTTTIYHVTVKDEKYLGCYSEDTVLVYATENQELVIPNLITPNGDAYNQYLEVKDVGNQKVFEGTMLEIRNRWGETVYRNSNYDNTFDGGNLSDGIYYYQVKSGCGTNSYKGWVQITR